jgi:hypothetical protein
VNGKIARKNGSIVLRDLEGKEKVRWNFVQGWPTKWDGPDFTAKGNDVAIETLEIAHEGIERASDDSNRIQLHAANRLSGQGRHASPRGHDATRDGG